MIRSHFVLILLAFAGSASQLASSELIKQAVADHLDCNPWFINEDPTKLVCICRDGQCDEINFEWPQQSGQMTLVQSSQLGRRFEASNLTEKDSSAVGIASTSIHVQLDKERQKIIGWGGAFTDATGVNLNSLPKETAEMLIASYFGKQGLQYNIARVPIGGTDFSARAYSYDDSVEADLELSKWALADEDLNLKIPHVKRAMELVQERGQELKLFATPWSAPAWMKTTKSIACGHLIDSDEIYTSYTNYLMKFYDAYEQNGVKFWGSTVQNEPLVSLPPNCYYNSMSFFNFEMSKLISKYLGPAMRARGWTKDSFKLMVGDDALGFINYQCPSLLSNSEVLEYVSGLAFHWYASGRTVSYQALDDIHSQFGDKIEFTLMTEACTAWTPQDNSQTLGNWTRAEMYAADIIEDLTRNTAGWVDWNMALDMGGGPNWVQNFVDSPIKVDAEKGEFYKQPMYYALAHFSRLFVPGSVGLATKVQGYSVDAANDVLAVAVLNKQTGHLVLNILNRSSEPRIMKVHVECAQNGTHNPQVKPFQVEANSISSLVIKL